MEICGNEKFTPNTLQADIRVLTEMLMSFRDYATNEFKLFRELQHAVVEVRTKCEGKCSVYDERKFLVEKIDNDLRNVQNKVGESEVKIKNIEEDSRTIFNLIEKTFNEIKGVRELNIGDINSLTNARKDSIWKSFNILLVAINVAVVIIFSILSYFK